MNSSTQAAISQLIAACSPFPQPTFILFFSVLHHNFLSSSQLTPPYYIICLKANATERGTKFILLFAFHVSSH